MRFRFALFTTLATTAIAAADDVPEDEEIIEMHAQAPRADSDSSYTLTKDEIDHLPGAGTDGLASVRSLPGVASSPAAAAGRLVLRGGAPQDGLLEIDGVPVPFVYHAFDNSTILPVSMIGAIAYSPGGFGAEEGRATSGMVGITTSDDIPAHATAQGSLSLTDASAAGAVPLSVAHGVYLSGGLRRSTVDLLIPFVMPDGVMVGFTTPPRYYDGQLELTWLATAHDRVAVMALTSYDRLGVVNHMIDSDLPSDFASDSKFGRVIASWKHDEDRVKNRLVAALGTGALHAKYDQLEHVDGQDALALVRDDVSIDVVHGVRVHAGGFAEVDHHDLDAQSILITSDGLPPGHFHDVPVQTIDTAYDTTYAAAYGSADLVPRDGTTITLGGRVEHFGHIGATVLEPRVAVTQKAGALTLHAAAGSYARDPSQLEGIPTGLAPERATQISGGTDIDLGEGITAAATVYHTSRSALAVEDSTQMTGADTLPYASTGRGTTGGVDLLLRVHKDHAFGWLAYTFSRTTRQESQMVASHASPFDQTHALTAVGSYERGAWRYGARVQYASGLPYTDVVGATYSNDLGHYLPVLGATDGARYPDVLRVDVRVEHVWKTKNVLLAAFADIGNVMRQARVERYAYNADFSQRSAIDEFVPIPSIGIRGEL